MTLDEIERKLREKFIGKRCRIRGCHGGSETTYLEGGPIVRIIAGQEFRRVKDVDVRGPPSAWNWYARFIFEDGTISTLFTRMGDVEVET